MNDSAKQPEFPEAKISDSGSFVSWLTQSTAPLWVVTAACFCVAIFLAVRSLSPPGEEIIVHFQNGYGLKAEDLVRYRGIVIGEVDAVELDERLKGVNVSLRLTENAAALAREGTQFWIERPKLSLGSVRGLETLIGGRYVAASPGPDAAASQREFVGIEEPPPLVDVGEGGLELLLIAENRFGLERGAPVTYRGFRVGQVVATSLSPNAMSIEVIAIIEQPYRHLVRTNSQFWNNGGMDFKIGLRGVDVDVDTLSSLAAGGIGFATPQPAGEPAPNGKIFELAPEEVEGWQDWQPLMDIGEALRSRMASQDPDKPGIFQRLRARLTNQPLEDPAPTDNPDDADTEPKSELDSPD